MLDEMGSGLGHASRTTARAEPPALATERHQLLVPAGIALDAQESVFEASALQVRLALFDDEVGERDTFGIKTFEKPREVLLDEGVERGLLGAVTFVRGYVAGQSRSRAGGHRSSVVMEVVLRMRSGSGVTIESSVPSGIGHRLAVTCLQGRLTTDVGEFIFPTLGGRLGWNIHGMNRADGLEIYISQGAKPGLGGPLMAKKVIPEFARIRGIPPASTCAPRRRTLKPKGVRIGTAEVYRQLERIEEVTDSVVVGQEWQGDTRIVPFVQLREPAHLDDALIRRIGTRLRTGASPRLVPDRIIQVHDIPRTSTGKVSEFAVRAAIHSREVTNRDALENPEALARVRARPAAGARTLTAPDRQAARYPSLLAANSG